MLSGEILVVVTICAATVVAGLVLVFGVFRTLDVARRCTDDVGRLREDIAELQADNTALRAWVAELEARLDSSADRAGETGITDKGTSGAD